MEIPIFINDENIGQIDIDSPIVNPFSIKDTILLEFFCREVATLDLIKIVQS